MKFSYFILFVFAGFGFPAQDFEESQKKFPRVKKAYENCEVTILKELKNQNLDEKKFRLIWVCFKKEMQVQMWLSGGKGMPFKKVKTFEVCASSGKPGPKRLQGDWQVPEGFYHINRFNPQSRYHLAMQVNYPNASDRIFSKGKNPGGDIMIHGACITIGCLPMTNEGIEEMYTWSVKASQNGQDKIPVYIFPCNPEDEQFTELMKESASDKNLVAFWKNIQKGYSKFIQNPTELKFSISSTGEYIF